MRMITPFDGLMVMNGTRKFLTGKRERVVLTREKKFTSEDFKMHDGRKLVFSPILTTFTIICFTIRILCGPSKKNFVHLKKLRLRYFTTLLV